MADATPAPGGHDPRIDVVIDVAADTNRKFAEFAAETRTNLASLTSDTASLTRIVRLHLVHDHGYEDPDDDTGRPAPHHRPPAPAPHPADRLSGRVGDQ